MEKTKTKKPVVIHNLIKIKALLFLSMLRKTDKRAVGARAIITAIGGNADSLYVLLDRWCRWGLVTRIETTPYVYMIGEEGLRYLSKIDNWFFSGYYSRKRKKRVPGYRGKVEDLKREIAVASRAVFWWRYTGYKLSDHEKENNKGIVYYIKAPFEKADDFAKIEGSEGRAVSWPKDRLLIVRFESAHAAYEACGPHKNRDLGQAIINAKLGMGWAKDAQ